jgi:hypothetical protein
MEDIITSESTTQPAQELPHSANPDGPSVEHQRLAGEIRQLWSAHVEAKSAARRMKAELKETRKRLAGPLSEMKALLAKPGRNGGWSAFLRSEGIAKAVAERLARNGREPAGTQAEVTPTASPSLAEPSGASRAPSCEAGGIAAEATCPASLPPEGDANPADASAADPNPQLSGDIPANPDELPASVPRADPIPHSSTTGEPSGETAATPIESAQVAAAVDAGENGGDVVAP